MHPAELDDEQLLKDCKIELTRRKGPGGQHRNKVETAVVLLHLPSGVSAEANEKRSQAENRRVALFRLRIQLAILVRTERSSLPSPRLKSRIKNGRLTINPSHQDFPPVLAEVMDHFKQQGQEIPEVAKIVGTSGSQLLKFLRLSPVAFENFNQNRVELGLPRIKY